MKKFLLICSVLVASLSRAWACNVCKREQPEGFENITHGVGPEGIMDYVITYFSIAIVGICVYLSIKYLIRPGEKEPSHIKNIVLNGKYGI